MTGVLDRVEDVAALIAQRCGGRVNVARLHVLLFYCQAWHVVFGGGRLFSAQIQAWVSGPVVTRLMRVQVESSPRLKAGDSRLELPTPRKRCRI